MNSVGWKNDPARAYMYKSTHSVHLDRQGNLPEDVVRFVISEISLAVDYLHQKKIVHR